MRNRIKAAVLLFFLAGVVGFSGKEKTNAFYTGYDEKTNSVEAGCNESEITEDFPSPDSIPISENPSYKKTVQVFNVPEASGSKSVSCYVRVSLSYSDADIGKAVKLLGTDTQNWVYHQDDGYYYYVPVLKAGESTTPRCTGLQIDSKNVEDLYGDRISDFRIQVYEETVQATRFDNYESAWEYFLNPVNSI